MLKIWMGILLVFFLQGQAARVFAADPKTEVKPSEVKSDAAAKPEAAKTEVKKEVKAEAKPEAAKTEAKPMEASKPKTVYKTPRKSQVVGFDASGNPVYFGENYPSRQASVDELQGSLVNTSANIARTVCDLSVRPQTIMVPVGAASLTWDTEKLCKAAKSDKLK